jgi:hypothetical protein
MRKPNAPPTDLPVRAVAKQQHRRSAIGLCNTQVRLSTETAREEMVCRRFRRISANRMYERLGYPVSSAHERAIKGTIRPRQAERSGKTPKFDRRAVEATPGRGASHESGRR